MSQLKDLLVIELASVLAGPCAGMFLAEQGATVIKIENTKTGGDVTRSWRHKAEIIDNDVTAYFSCANWGKKSLAVNLSSSEGKNIVYELVKKADIILSSYKKGDDIKLGMSYEELRKLNHNIIYLSLNGFGNNSERIAYDAVLQAEAGFMHINGTTESGPIKMPVAFIDLFAAHQIKEAVLLAFIKKLKTGEGSFISLSLFESAIASLANQATNYLFTNQIPQPSGSLHPNIAPYGETFFTKDNKQILIAAGSSAQFKKLCKVLEINKVAEQEDFISNELRVQHRKKLEVLLAAQFKKFNCKEILEKLHAEKVPAAAINNIEEALQQPLAKQNMLHDNGFFGIRQSAFSIGKPLNLLPPPHFGQHSKEILEKFLSYKPQIINELTEEGIII